MKELGITPSQAEDPKVRNKENRKLEASHGIKFAAYSLRHGFATRKLMQGNDGLIVAAWIGHRDGTMLSRVYSHVAEQSEFLHEKLSSESAESHVTKG